MERANPATDSALCLISQSPLIKDREREEVCQDRCKCEADGQQNPSHPEPVISKPRHLYNNIHHISCAIRDIGQDREHK